MTLIRNGIRPVAGLKALNEMQIDYEKTSTANESSQPSGPKRDGPEDGNNRTRHLSTSVSFFTAQNATHQAV